MWTAITVIGLFAAVAIIAARVISRPADETEHNPHEQPTTVDPVDDDFPTPGSGNSPHRPDGSPVEGSEEHRNEHGRS